MHKITQIKAIRQIFWFAEASSKQATGDDNTTKTFFYFPLYLTRNDFLLYFKCAMLQNAVHYWTKETRGRMRQTCQMPLHYCVQLMR